MGLRVTFGATPSFYIMFGEFARRFAQALCWRAEENETQRRRGRREENEREEREIPRLRRPTRSRNERERKSRPAPLGMTDVG